jgi:hypothetical protein
MEVLEIGKVKSKELWSKEITCVECEAKLSVITNDLQHFHCFGTHFRHDYVGISCPLCAEKNAIKDVPEPIRKEILKLKSTFDGCDDSIY